MKSEININPAGDTITIREGKALDLKHPEKINLSGNIESISAFLSKRYGERNGLSLQLVEKDKSVVVVDETNMNMKLFLDPENAFGTEVLAILLFNPDLLEFHINEEFDYSREAMIKLLKFRKRHFANPLSQEELLGAYMKLNLSGTTQIKSESDDRGNRDFAFKKNIDSQNIPKSFTLELPIFKGQPVEKFRVDITLDVTDLSVRFRFESVELVELIEERKRSIFAHELESCTDFVIIHK